MPTMSNTKKVGKKVISSLLRQYFFKKEINSCFFLKFFKLSRFSLCRPEWNSLFGNAVSPDPTRLDQTGRLSIS